MHDGRKPSLAGRKQASCYPSQMDPIGVTVGIILWQPNSWDR
jgi:hypothetical protein